MLSEFEHLRCLKFRSSESTCALASLLLYWALSNTGHEKYKQKFGHKTWRTRSFGKPSSRVQTYVGNIKIYLRETWDELMEWIHTAQGKVHLQIIFF